MLLEIRNISKTYRHAKKQETALSSVNLTVQQGEFVGILGRSGAGKSTLIRCINQLVRPCSGEIVWRGKQLSKTKGKTLRQARSEMGMIFQQFNLIPRLTALQNAVLGCFSQRPMYQNLLGMISSRERQLALEALERVGIVHLADKRVDQLSGGQQQRVAIARVIMQKPHIILGDEPVASLDPVTSKQVMQLVQAIVLDNQLTAIMNLHDVTLALEFCDRIIGLYQGRVVFDGKPHQVDDQVLERIYAPATT